MADNSLQIEISAKDSASSQLKTVEKNIQSLGKQASDTANNQFSDFGKKIDSTFIDIAKSAAKYALTAGTALLGATTFAVKNAADVQMLRQNFDTMLGSAEKGRKLFTDLQNMANVTPFETQDLADASQTLLAFGVNNEKLLPILKNIGDVSMGNKDRFKQLSLAFAQVSANGKLQGQDLLQMVNGGFNPLLIMSQKTGKSLAEMRKEMDKGAISSQDVAQAFQDATAQGGQFYNGMENGSRTFNGVMSTLSDNVKIVARSIVGLSATGDVVKGGLFDKLSIAANDFGNYLNANRDQIIQVGIQLINFTLDAGKKFIDTVIQITNFLRDHQAVIKNVVIPAIEGLVGALVVLRTALAIADAVKAFNAAMVALQLASQTSALMVGGLSTVLAALPLAIVVGVSIIGYEKMHEQILGLNKDLDTLAQSQQRASDLDNNIYKQAQDAKAKGDTARYNKLMGLYSQPSTVQPNYSWLEKLLVKGFAGGTNSAPGGLAVVGENGPELVNLPRGSQVTPAGETKNILNNSGSTFNITNYFSKESDPSSFVREISLRLASR